MVLSAIDWLIQRIWHDGRNAPSGNLDIATIHTPDRTWESYFQTREDASYARMAFQILYALDSHDLKARDIKAMVAVRLVNGGGSALLNSVGPLVFRSNFLERMLEEDWVFFEGNKTGDLVCRLSDNGLEFYKHYISPNG